MFYYQQPLLYQKRIVELETAEERVCWFLYRFEHLRDCDKCLIMKYWGEVDGLKLNVENLDPVVVHGLTSSETIRRVRAHIQNDLGFFLPTSEEVKEARAINQEATRKWLSNQKKLNEF